MDKSISIDLGDPRTGKVAEALSNKTCVKILDLLASQELTASDIAVKLGIPLNTTGYNLDKLIAAGLVEKSSNFFWSVKGKKTPVYKVANKKIVISPKRIIAKVLPFFLIAGVLAIITASFVLNDSRQNISSVSSDLETFDSYDDLTEYIEKSRSAAGNAYGLFGRGEGAVSSDSTAPSLGEAGTKSSVGGTGSSDYSGTNIQVVGVDEADIVKNDGKYIYTVNQNKVIIVEAYPADSMKVIEELDFDNYVNGIFLSEGKLVIIESSYGYSLYAGTDADAEGQKIADTIRAPDTYRNEVRVHIYDISELSSGAVKLETFVLDGNYYTARLIEGYVYIISNKYIDTSGPIMPYFRAGDNIESVTADRIYYPGYYDSNLIFTSVMAIDLENLDYEGNVFLLGSSVIYVSQESIYLTSSKTYDYSKVQEDALQVILKVLPGEYSSKVEDILDSENEYYIKADKVAFIVQDYFNSLSIDEKKDFENALAEANKEYYMEVSKEYEKTVIHRIDIDGLDISYSVSGEVPGYVLNQFSMDEFEGNLRIATTSGNSFGSFENSFNHLYVLNKDLEIVGSVENLAEGERIYSARFVGDKAYMVTFRQVDPLYVIDLTNSEEPEVLGYLKVTGFSNYLHPIGDNLLLGIGREADTSGRSQGLKISLFDISDFNNPKEIDKYVVESEWSYSEAEYEHKAVLFDDKRDLLVIPATYSEHRGSDWQYWQGAFAFTITDTDISLKGKIAHDTKNEKIEEYYGSYGYVQRSLFMDDILYTISNLMIKANKIEDLYLISEIDLPFEEPVYYAF